jgi:hypothetical protein
MAIKQWIKQGEVGVGQYGFAPCPPGTSLACVPNFRSVPLFRFPIRLPITRRLRFLFGRDQGEGWTAPGMLGQVEELTSGQRIYGAIGLATGVAAAYHGYRRGREHPVWNAIGWSLLGSWFWPVTLPVMLAQGFGKAK